MRIPVTRKIAVLSFAALALIYAVPVLAEDEAPSYALKAGFGKGASTTLLPPTLLLQYHFFPNRRIRPYVGAGVNFTLPIA